MKQARDYRKYNVRLTSADWQRGSGRVISHHIHVQCNTLINALYFRDPGVNTPSFVLPRA